MATLNYRFATELPKVEAEFKGDVITLTGVKTCASLSDETPCFTATLRRNGKIVAKVSNGGNGGCNNIEFTDENYECSLTFAERTQLVEDITNSLYDIYDTNKCVGKEQKKAIVMRRIKTYTFGGCSASLTEIHCAPLRSPIEAILADSAHRKALIGILKKFLENGYEILNTNLAELNED